MANIPVKDASGVVAYVSATGTGTNADPFIPAHTSVLKAKGTASGDTELAATSTGELLTSARAVKLVKGNAAEVVTCTDANTDYAATTAMADGVKYVACFASAAAIVSMGEATSATVGVGIPAGLTIFPVTRTGTAADDKPHAQSATAGATIRFSYFKG
jgi:hypothetical protein